MFWSPWSQPLMTEKVNLSNVELKVLTLSSSKSESEFLVTGTARIELGPVKESPGIVHGKRVSLSVNNTITSAP